MMISLVHFHFFNTAIRHLFQQPATDFIMTVITSPIHPEIMWQMYRTIGSLWGFFLLLEIPLKTVSLRERQAVYLSPFDWFLLLLCDSRWKRAGLISNVHMCNFSLCFPWGLFAPQSHRFCSLPGTSRLFFASLRVCRCYSHTTLVVLMKVGCDLDLTRTKSVV